MILASKTYTDAEARRILQKEGITVNSPKPKTSLDGIQVNSINGLIGFKKDCKCDIVVTGKLLRSRNYFAHDSFRKLK